MIQVGKDGFYHPRNEGEVSELVKYAIKQKIQVRIKGAGQSAPGSILSDTSDKNINIILNKMRSVKVNRKHKTVTVGAGCHLGYDPYSKSSTVKNSLYTILEKNQLAIPNIPDAAHQTIGGFISTGSSGATMTYSFLEAILSITIVDGNGKIQTLDKTADLNNPFYGVVVAMGLCGVITSVTLQCVPSFDIIGSERTADMSDTSYDFFGPGKKGHPSLKDHFSKQTFARTLWWPYHTLHRGISWQARVMKKKDYTSTTGSHEKLKTKRYHPVFPKILGSYLPSEAFASTGFTLISSFPNWLYDLIGNSGAEISPVIKAGIQKLEALAPSLYPFLINLYFPKNDDKNPPQQFWDRWNGSLPMDRIEFSNHLMNLDYTELWFPMAKAQKVINTLKEFYDKEGVKATGFYTVEVLAGKSCPFWMSPSYNQDSLRLNFMWFKKGAPEPYKFYQQFYDLFKEKKIPFRVHWGKYLPNAKGTTGPKYMKTQYPKWKQFIKLRKSMDPNNVFLTSYWKEHLGL